MTVPPTQADQLYISWQGRITKVCKQLQAGFWHQQIWTEFHDELGRLHPDADATFLASYTRQHVAAQMLLVRRLIDPDSRSHSLASLIRAIGKNPGVITRSRYVGRCAELLPDGGGERGERAWHQLYADPDDREQFATAILAADLGYLGTEFSHIKHWADKTIAHLDRKPPARVPLYREIPEALERLADVSGRYEDILTQSVTTEWTPIIQGDWQEPFRPALFPIDNALLDSAAS